MKRAGLGRMYEGLGIAALESTELFKRSEADQSLMLGRGSHHEEEEDRLYCVGSK